jgi:ATP synthase H subunit
MAKGSEDIKEYGHAVHKQGHAHASSHDSQFMEQVRRLKSAEQSAASRVEEAKKEAARIEASAREQAVALLTKAQEKAVEAKNEILSKGREQSDREIHEILAQARKQAGSIKQKKLSDSEIASLAQL